jgi:hypothetical protein
MLLKPLLLLLAELSVLTLLLLRESLKLDSVSVCTSDGALLTPLSLLHWLHAAIAA